MLRWATSCKQQSLVATCVATMLRQATSCPTQLCCVEFRQLCFDFLVAIKDSCLAQRSCASCQPKVGWQQLCYCYQKANATESKLAYLHTSCCPSVAASVSMLEAAVRSLLVAIALLLLPKIKAVQTQESKQNRQFKNKVFKQFIF